MGLQLSLQQEDSVAKFANSKGDGNIIFNEFWLNMHFEIGTEEDKEDDDIALGEEQQCLGVRLVRVNELFYPALNPATPDFSQKMVPIDSVEEWGELITARPWATTLLRRRVQVRASSDCRSIPRSHISN
eukprot:1178188-Prorocentrum_minimum.AAC.2